MIEKNGRSPDKKKLKVFMDLQDAIEAMGKKRAVAKEMIQDGQLVISKDVMQAMWALFFGQANLEKVPDDTRRALMVLGIYEDKPFLGWNFNNLDIQSVLSLVGIIMYQLSDQCKKDLMTPFGHTLISMGSKFNPDEEGDEEENE